LLGHFNLHNALAALSALCVHGVAFDDALAVFPRLSPVAGRMERVAAAEGPLVIVDYAHTPDALEQDPARGTRQHCRGRLHVRVRLRWRSRPRQAAADGRDRLRSTPTPSC
jgi:UDP-N-acetylmuramoyl-L-alanyl-D-glutamate--2,6-diaminopimelate ligase